MNTTMLWGAGIVLALVVGWLLRGLMDRPRLAAERAVAQERMARLEAELTAARSAAEAQAHAPEQVAQVMAPVQTALSRLEEAVARAEGGRASSTAQLAEQMRAVAQATSASTDGLRRETARLVGALGHSEVRGRWGEFQLRRLLESSGLVRDVHFTEQQSVSTDSGILRPDVVLHLGEHKSVVVDAKVSLRAILGIEAGDPQDEVAAARAQHAREVRSHVDRLASKEYARQFDTAPEFVVMFLPAESLLAEALACDPALLEHAFDRNVVLATPTTLMALTRTVGHIWRQDALAANAQEVQALGRELAERLATMLGHLDKLGSSLGSGVTAYNRAIASLESRVLVTGRRFTEMQGLPIPLEAPRQVDQQPRSLATRMPAQDPPNKDVPVEDLAGLSLTTGDATVQPDEHAPGLNLPTGDAPVQPDERALMASPRAANPLDATGPDALDALDARGPDTFDALGPDALDALERQALETRQPPQDTASPAVA